MKLGFRITVERTKKGKKLGGKMDSGQFGVFTNTIFGPRNNAKLAQKKDDPEGHFCLPFSICLFQLRQIQRL